MDKIKLPQEIANIADYIQKLCDDKYNLKIVMEYLDLKMSEALNSFLNDATEERYALWYGALVNGYEVEEKMPEYRIRKLCEQTISEEKNLGDHPQSSYWRGKQQGIQDTLLALGIFIEGVNA